MTEAQAAWYFAAFLVVIAAVLAIVLQAFALHAALARHKVHAPEAAGMGLFVRWLPTIALWLAAGFALGANADPARCTQADVTAVWLGALYPLTGWPPAWIAWRKKIRLPGWYWIAIVAVGISVLVMAGFACV